MNKNLTNDGTNYGDTIKSAWVNGRMSKDWWIGVFFGAFSCIFTWNLYKQYNAFLNSQPTLLGLIILLGFFLSYTLFLRVLLFGINILFKKLWEILITSLGIQNTLKSGLWRNRVKTFLIKVAVGGLIWAVLFSYLGEKYNSLVDGIPDWLKLFLGLGILLGLFGLFRSSYLCNKKRMQNQHSDKENKIVTP